MDSSKNNDIKPDQPGIPTTLDNDPTFPSLPEDASVQKLVYAKEHNEIEKYVNVENSNVTVVIQLAPEAAGGGKIPFSIKGSGQERQLPHYTADVTGLIADSHKEYDQNHGSEDINPDALWPDEVNFQYYNLVVYGASCMM